VAAPVAPVAAVAAAPVQPEPPRTRVQSWAVSLPKVHLPPPAPPTPKPAKDEVEVIHGKLKTVEVFARESGPR